MVRGDEERVIVAFCSWLEQNGWTNIRRVKGHWNLPSGGRETCPVTVTGTAR